MKLSVAAFFGSTGSKKASSKHKKKSKSRSSSSAAAAAAHGDASFGSNATSSSSSSSDDSSHLRASPRSVLPSSIHDLFGRDGDGKIPSRELEAVLRRLGSDAEDVAGLDGGFTEEELEALGAALEAPVADAEAELREAFAVFDADGDGKISAEELLGVFVTLGDDSCTMEDCRHMIQGVDTDGDGFVCFSDFVRMMDGQR